MKKLLLIGILVVLAGCSTNSGSVGSPPPVSLKVAEKSHQMELGSYSWSKKTLFTSQGVSVDAKSPYEMARDIEPIQVEKSSVIELETSGDPTVSVYIWALNRREQDVSHEDNKFEAPIEAGKYIYEVFAEWPKGDGSYAIVVEVK
ncbi:hypothetical protein [Ornithinibacillus californiensis]|uniref:hypothetical protein n=1 Tax=Ornithinibacillus californiensis TaxID=161536 RepID=UPI00064D7F58|nr:hypothetical protein [Ornithinibacillus californiensis]